MSLEKDLWEQQVLQNELNTMKLSDGRVYKQQPGSNVFFLIKKTDALASCKLKQTHLTNLLSSKSK